ncbi:MAG: hypothetical protein WC735_00490 [Candidatus Paceibacterota bacterium]|jgi:hypothetical protein
MDKKFSAPHPERVKDLFARDVSERISTAEAAQDQLNLKYQNLLGRAQKLLERLESQMIETTDGADRGMPMQKGSINENEREIRKILGEISELWNGRDGKNIATIGRELEFLGGRIASLEAARPGTGKEAKN